MSISVVVCTYNRSDLLAGAVESICRQSLSPDAYEILVIDNASTDATQSVVKGYIASYPTHAIRYIYEGEPGLAHARNVALHQANGDYISYLDDDALAEPDWLKQASEIIDGTSQAIDCLGGPILPFYTDAKPFWFKDEYETYDWGSEPRMLHAGESFYGSNMIWRRSTLQLVGGFNIDQGVKSDLLSVGEEISSFRLLWQSETQPILLYFPSLIVRHWVPQHKMTVYYRLKRAFVVGQSYVQLGRHREINRLAHLVRTSGSITAKLIEAFARLRQYPHRENWMVEEGQQIAHRLGILLGLLGIFPAVRQRPT